LTEDVRLNLTEMNIAFKKKVEQVKDTQKS
jgi:hypothetical protein